MQGDATSGPTFNGVMLRFANGVEWFATESRIAQQNHRQNFKERILNSLYEEWPPIVRKSLVNNGLKKQHIPNAGRKMWRFWNDFGILTQQIGRLFLNETRLETSILTSKYEQNQLQILPKTNKLRPGNPVKAVLTRFF